MKTIQHYPNWRLQYSCFWTHSRIWSKTGEHQKISILFCFSNFCLFVCYARQILPILYISFCRWNYTISDCTFCLLNSSIFLSSSERKVHNSLLFNIILPNLKKYEVVVLLRFFVLFCRPTINPVWG